MKRIVCFVLVLFFIFPFASCDHDLDSSEKDPCSKGHDFQKNECKNCDYKATEISQLPLEYRKEIAKEIKLIAPVSSDIETVKSLSDLYFLTVIDIETNEMELQEAIERFNSVPMVRVYQNGYWVWVQHEPSLIAAEKDIEAAKKAKAQNEELLLTLRDSIQLNAKGAAWNVVIEELESETTSNQKIAQRLLAVFFACSYYTGISTTSLEQEIFDTFREKTGLEIDMSQALS